VIKTRGSAIAEGFLQHLYIAESQTLWTTIWWKPYDHSSFILNYTTTWRTDKRTDKRTVKTIISITALSTAIKNAIN